MKVHLARDYYGETHNTEVYSTCPVIIVGRLWKERLGMALNAAKANKWCFSQVNLNRQVCKTHELQIFRTRCILAIFLRSHYPKCLSVLVSGWLTHEVQLSSKGRFRVSLSERYGICFTPWCMLGA